MNTAFRDSFDADLTAIADPALLARIKKVIEQVEAARTFRQRADRRLGQGKRACARRPRKRDKNDPRRESSLVGPPACGHLM